MMSENWPEGKHYVETANLPKAFFDNVEQGGDSKLLFEKRDGTGTGAAGEKYPKMCAGLPRCWWNAASNLVNAS